MNSEFEFCFVAVFDVVLCCRFKDAARPLDPVLDAFLTLPVLLTGRGMVDVSSDLEGGVTEVGGSKCLKVGSVVVILL